MMPRLDQTGPTGQGPLSGRGLGRCGRGPRNGVGINFGRGCGRRYFTKSEEKDVLEEDIKFLEEDLRAAKERLSEIQKG